jgi:hypothetical protein
LLGADIVLHQSIEDDMQHMMPTRAPDGEVPLVFAIFRGGSYAVSPSGDVLEKLPADAARWHVFEVKPFEVRAVERYGCRWVRKMGDLNIRRPSAYTALTDPSTRPPWTEALLDDKGRRLTEEQLRERLGGRYDQDDPALYHTPLVAFERPWTSPFSVDPEWPFHFVNREGEHLFALNKTAWAYFMCCDPDGFLRRSREQGINVIRAHLEGRPYYEQLGMDLWPWLGTREDPDWSGFDEEYWDEVERRVRLAGEHGIGIDLCLYFSLHPTSGEIELHRPYWEHTLRRLGKYANIFLWEIANEHVDNEGFQSAAGADFRERDPYHRPVCTSAGSTDDAVWPSRPWVDIAVVHTCTSSGDRHGLRDWYLALARNTRAHGKPAFCNESGREERHGNDDPVHRRKQGWLWCASGCFWTWHSWEGCEGIDDRDYRGPGQQFLKPMADFFQSLPFWRLQPNYTALVAHDDDLASAVLAEENRELVVGYFCTPRSGTAVRARMAGLRLPEGVYRISFYDPRRNTIAETRELAAPGIEIQTPLALPDFEDDIAIRVDRISAGKRMPMSGTE